MSARWEPRAGEVVADRYRLITLCGAGGMARVWRALHLPDQRECALKLMHRASPDPLARYDERFLREAMAASSIDSPYTVRVHDYGTWDGVPFIAMELLEGETLAGRLRSVGRLSPLETCRILGEVACAIERAHELGIVHRDLKPDNVFLAHLPSGTVTKVLDFGIAKVQDDAAYVHDLTETGAMLGTPHYMSPEQVDGARYVDHRADLWSLGVIAFECLIGQRPFRGEGVRALLAAICVQPAPIPSAMGVVPAGFDDWFAKATEKDPRKRFRSAREMASSLRCVCEQSLSTAVTLDEPRVEGVERLPAPAARRGLRVGLGRAAAAWVSGALGLLASIGWLYNRAPASSAIATSSRASAVEVAERSDARISKVELTRTPPAPAPSPQPSVELDVAPEDPGPRTKERAPSPRALVPARVLPSSYEASRLTDGSAHRPPVKRWDVERMLRDRK